MPLDSPEGSPAASPLPTSPVPTASPSGSLPLASPNTYESEQSNPLSSPQASGDDAGDAQAAGYSENLDNLDLENLEGEVVMEEEEEVEELVMQNDSKYSETLVPFAMKHYE